MHSVLFLWPSNDAEVESFRKYEHLEDAYAYGLETMRSMPGAVMCVITRPDRPSIRIWWETHHLVSNLTDLERAEPSLAQKLDWRKDGF